MTSDGTHGGLIRRAVGSAVINYVGKLVGLGTWFFLTPFILRQLGEDRYGLWVLVGSVIGYGLLLDLGIEAAIVKYIAEHLARGETEQARSLVATSLWLYSLLGLLAVALSVGIAPIVPDLFNVSPDQRSTATWLVLIMGSTVGILIPCTTALAVLRGLQRYDLVNLIDTVGMLLHQLAIIGVLLLGGGVVGMVAVYIPIILGSQLASVGLINRIAPELRFGWRGARRELAGPVVRFSASLFAVQVGRRLQSKTDEIVIGAFMPLSAVTSYAISRKLAELAHVLTHQFVKVLLPLASEVDARDDSVRLRSLYIISTRLTLAIFLPIGCAVVVLAGPVLATWVGVEYADNTLIVAILTAAGVILTSQWPAITMLQGMARHRWLAVSSIVFGLANLGLSTMLVQPFGLAGVAVGTLIPTAIECFGFILPYTMRVMGVSAIDVAREVLLPALVPAAPTVLVLFALRDALEPSSLPSLILVAGVGLAVYASVYLAVGARDIERRAYRDLASSTLRCAAARVRR